MDDAVQTVMTRCELWTDNNDMEPEENVMDFHSSVSYVNEDRSTMMVAESQTKYEQE